MTHANTFTLEDGWAVLRQMLATIAARFGTLTPAPLARDVYEELLQWLRPAEHLARLMVYIIARAMAPVMRVARTSAKRVQTARSMAFRFALRISPSLRRVRTARMAGLFRWRPPRAPRAVECDGWPKGVFEELRPPLRAPMPAPAPASSAPVLFMPAAPLAARLAALARVLTDPGACARRIAAHVRVHDAAATDRLLDPRRVFTRTPCGGALIFVHDLAFALGAPRAPDSS